MIPEGYPISQEQLESAGPLLVGILGGFLIFWGASYLVRNRKRSRFLDGGWFYVAIGLLVCASHTMWSIWAIQGDETALYVIIALSYFWTVLCLLNGHGWHRSLKSNRNTLDQWDLSNKMLDDHQKLLGEALTDLETWDREKALDIAERWNTITMLRFQSMKEMEARE